MSGIADFTLTKSELLPVFVKCAFDCVKQMSFNASPFACRIVAQTGVAIPNPMEGISPKVIQILIAFWHLLDDERDGVRDKVIKEVRAVDTMHFKVQDLMCFVDDAMTHVCTTLAKEAKA